MAGFKFTEIKNMLLESTFDVFVIIETKIDKSLPNSHFYIKGFKPFCKDRILYGGGIIIYVRSDIASQRLEYLECNTI